MNQQEYSHRTKELIAMTDSDIDKLVEVAAQENSPNARRRLFQAIRLAEVFVPCAMDPHDPKTVRSTPLARLTDGTHAMMLFTAKTHPHLSEHQHFAGAAFTDHLSAALKMPPLDWVILSNTAWHRVAIHKQQIAAILDDLNSDGRGQNAPQAASASDSAGTIIEDFITRSANRGVPTVEPASASSLQSLLVACAQPQCFAIEHDPVIRIIHDLNTTYSRCGPDHIFQCDPSNTAVCNSWSDSAGINTHHMRQMLNLKSLHNWLTVRALPGGQLKK